VELNDKQPAKSVFKSLHEIQGLFDKLTPLKVNSRTPVEQAVSAAEFMLEGMTAHKKISRSEARTFTAGEKRRRNEDAANLAERARDRLQERDIEDIARNRTRRGFN
jgi:magnesium chelatase subunit I